MRTIIENSILTCIVILSASEESLKVIIHNIWRFFVSLRMTKTLSMSFRPQCSGVEKSPENRPAAQEISLRLSRIRNDSKVFNDWRFFTAFRMTKTPEMSFSRYDNKVSGVSPYGRNDNIRLKSILLLFILAFIFTTTTAQNIMQIKNAQGVVNSNIDIPISIANDEEFISFQCDVLLPDGFTYIPNSITLTSRSVDHVVNVTNIENNIIRILSYSLNNTAFLADSGDVATIGLTTPQNEGDYIVGINNGIIGNPESVNILDSIVNGEITLGPIGINENNFEEDKIQCFPNPIIDIVTIQINSDNIQALKLQVFDVKGVLISTHDVDIVENEPNSFCFSTNHLLGNNPSNGSYFIHFVFGDGNQQYSTVKMIQLKK